MVLPDSSLFLHMYIRKEAVLSSQIEGTQSSLSDLLAYRKQKMLRGPRLTTLPRFLCYVCAMTYGMGRLQELPLSLRLIREIHGKLMQNARGAPSNQESCARLRTGSVVTVQETCSLCLRFQIVSETVFRGQKKTRKFLSLRV